MIYISLCNFEICCWTAWCNFCNRALQKISAWSVSKSAIDNILIWIFIFLSLQIISAFTVFCAYTISNSDVWMMNQSFKIRIMSSFLKNCKLNKHDDKQYTLWIMKSWWQLELNMIIFLIYFSDMFLIKAWLIEIEWVFMLRIQSIRTVLFWIWVIIKRKYEVVRLK